MFICDICGKPVKQGEFVVTVSNARQVERTTSTQLHLADEQSSDAGWIIHLNCMTFTANSANITPEIDNPLPEKELSETPKTPSLSSIVEEVCEVLLECDVKADKLEITRFIIQNKLQESAVEEIVTNWFEKQTGR